MLPLIQKDDSQEQSILLEDSIDRLPQKEKAVLALRYAGYTQHECGVIIGVTRSAVGFIHKRAIAMVKRFVAETENGTS